MNTELKEIFLPSTKKDNDDLIYETTSEYISSDGKPHPNKKKLSTITNIKVILDGFEPDNKEKLEIKSNRIIINKRSILLIKGKR